MGNQNTKEARSDQYPHASDLSLERRQLDNTLRRPTSRNRYSRADISLFGLNSPPPSGQQAEEAFEHKETRPEREARKLERERLVRTRERERSVREENVDGGFLVTLGTYTGTEDHSKSVVRQLQIERRLAPFWRGLRDFSALWTDEQLIAAAKGIQLVDPSRSRSDSTPEMMTGTPTDEPGPSQAASPNHIASAGTHSLSVGRSTIRRPSPSMKPGAKALAAVLKVGSRSSSPSDFLSRSTDLSPKETQLPFDPYVDGKPLEIMLYKNAIECPICFLTYPPYLNNTSCCHQPICSECFVQIKRPDPHLQNLVRSEPGGLEKTDQESAGLLISEPSACPYCQQSNFGVFYNPPPFRRGLVLATKGFNLSNSSNAPVGSAVSGPSLPLPSQNSNTRRRSQSLFANTLDVIATDMIRPDWASKLATARAHQARRAAAATALHTAAFVAGAAEQRTFSFRPPRFGRRLTPYLTANNISEPAISSSADPTDGPQDPQLGQRDPSGRSQQLVSGSGRMEELEDLMFMEAIRLSLASEKERLRKEEKDLRRESRKKRKEVRKAHRDQQKQRSPIYIGSSSPSGSASSLSLRLDESGSIARSGAREESAGPSLGTYSTLRDGRSVELPKLQGNAVATIDDSPSNELEQTKTLSGLRMGHETVTYLRP